MTQEQAQERVRTSKEFISATSVHATSNGSFFINASKETLERLEKDKTVKTWLIKGEETKTETAQENDSI